MEVYSDWSWSLSLACSLAQVQSQGQYPQRKQRRSPHMLMSLVQRWWSR